MRAELTQIIYKEEQRAECYQFANVYFNDKLTIFFENEVIKQVVSTSTAEKIGVCSWKLKQKQRWNVPKSREITQELLESDYDVLSFTRNTHHHQMLYAANRWHQGFIPSLKRIMDHIGIGIPAEVSQPIYANAFMARMDLYQEYLGDYLEPAMDAMSNDPTLYLLATMDSGYHKLARNESASPEWLSERIGLNYYPMAPFLLERLFSIYCHNKKINVQYI